MISVGIAQIPNSVDVAKNFEVIFSVLKSFEDKGVDVVLFPECSLSGFTAKMRECSADLLSPYLNQVHAWVKQTGIEVALPTAIVESGRIFNSGFWFGEADYKQFFKLGLTESEKKFFATPENPGAKVFSVKGYRLALLICYEIEHAPSTYFSEDQADAILWPGYWGWGQDSAWTLEKEPGKLNPAFLNAQSWGLPILQANFSCNDLDGHQGAGPEGLSFVIDHHNRLMHRGLHRQTDAFIVNLDKSSGQTQIVSCVGGFFEN